MSSRYRSYAEHRSVVYQKIMSLGSESRAAGFMQHVDVDRLLVDSGVPLAKFTNNSDVPNLSQKLLKISNSSYDRAAANRSMYEEQVRRQQSLFERVVN